MMETRAHNTPSARRMVALGLLVFLLSAHVDAVGTGGAVDAWVYAHAGLNHFYNADYEPALANFRQALTLEPEHPLFLNYLANAYLFRELYRTGQLDTQLYSESNSFLRAEKPKSDQETMDMVKELIERSQAISTRRLEKNPNDTTALYALGVSYGIEANYEFTLYKHWYSALRAGSKAKQFHERLKRLDPNYHDADLVLGLYEYTVGSIPATVKWLALLVGYRGSKERGIELLHSAMTQGRLATTDAAVLLAVIYNREKKYAYTRALLHKLAEYYPRNHLAAMEVARTYMREGNDQAALAEYLRVAQKVEGGAPGFERVSRERLYYQIGSLHQRLHNYEEALAAFEKITSAPEAEGLIKAHAGVRRGEIFLAQNRPELARRECERVLTMPYSEPRAGAQRLLQSLKKRQP